MNRTNQILAVVAVAQLVLAAIVFLPRSAGPATESGPLLADFTPAAVTELVIQDTSDHSITLARSEDDQWVLPAYDDYPVQTSQVEALLEDLRGLEADRLIARNPSSLNRLEVTDDHFQRRIEIVQGDRRDRLYIGSSAGANATHMRVNDAPEVYLVGGLAAWEVPAQLTSWVDTTYFTVPQSDVVAFRLENPNGVFEFEKHDDQWTLVGLGPDEVLDPTSIDAVLRQAARIRLSTPLGQQAEDRYGMDNPQAVVTLTVEETVTPAADEAGEPTPEAAAADQTPAPPATETVRHTYTLMLGAALDEGGYAFKSSESDYYVAVASVTAETFLNLTRESLLATPEETPTPEAEATP